MVTVTGENPSSPEVDLGQLLRAHLQIVQPMAGITTAQVSIDLIGR
jgi:hypothetical protein